VEPFTHDHLPGVADLLRATMLPEDAAEAADIVEVLRPRYDGVRRTTGWVETHEGRVVGVAFAAVNNADPHVGHLDLIAVHPEHQRRGLATRLLRQAEDGLRDFGCTIVRVAGNPPDYAFPGIDVRYTPAVCLVAKAGYAHDRTAWNMTADLDPQLLDTAADEVRLAGQDIEIKRAEADDIARLRPVIAAEFGGHWAAEITTAQAVHIAHRDGQPIAFAAWGCTRPSWFGPMGTLPQAKGLGIGSVLLKRCLLDQSKAGYAHAQIGWVGPVPFYAQAVNARIERVFFLYAKEL
jgi:GNAT superfamily N-acetyltransferase